MEFPDSWFNDEVREGFYVPGIMKRQWAAQLELLQALSQICERHHLRWSVAYGTMLGAVRHHGFIPWDDDMDIFMPADDCEKFKRYVSEELPARFCATVRDECDPVIPGFLSCIASSKKGFDASYAETYHEFPFPVSIDIFRLGYVSEDEEKEKQRDRHLLLLENIINFVKGGAPGVPKPVLVDTSTITLKGLENSRDPWAVQVCNNVQQMGNLIGERFDSSLPILHQLYVQYHKFATCFRREDCSTMAYLPFYTKRGRDRYPVSYFDDPIQMNFENTKVNVSREYDAILRYNYGNSYMTPIKGTAFHDYPVYRKYEKEFTDQSPFMYAFSEKDLVERPEDTYSPKKVVSESLSALQELHGSLHHVAKSGSLQPAFEILQYCQQLAVTVGNAIEHARSEAFLQTLDVEEYAEDVYQCFQAVDQNKTLTEKDLKKLDESLKKMAKKVQAQFLKRQEILFLPCMAERWQGFDSLWRVCKADPSCDVSVMPLAYFRKHGDGSFEEKPICDTNQYPASIHALPYQSYDIRKKHPDYIFIQFPYDLYNHVTSVDISYYSTALYPLTDHLVYIPWFQTCEFGTDSPVDVIAMDYYAKVPGVVRADLTVVQSEKIADTYRQVLTDFAGEDTKKIWDRKIQGWGTPLTDPEGTSSALWTKIRAHFASEQS